MLFCDVTAHDRVKSDSAELIYLNCYEAKNYSAGRLRQPSLLFLVIDHEFKMK